MATAHEILERASANLDESLGVRKGSAPVRLAPVPQGKDAGRLPNRLSPARILSKPLPGPCRSSGTSREFFWPNPRGNETRAGTCCSLLVSP